MIPVNPKIFRLLLVGVLTLWTAVVHVSAKTEPERVVREFYTWYRKAPQDKLASALSEKQDLFDPWLYAQLLQALKPSSSPKKRYLEVDPFAAGQMGYEDFKISSCAIRGNQAEVRVCIRSSRGAMSTEPAVAVVLRKIRLAWKIYDVKHLKVSDPKSPYARLRTYLKLITEPS